MVKKIQVEEVKEKDIKKDLKTFLVINMPGMFDRTPDITGDLDSFVEEILNVVK